MTQIKLRAATERDLPTLAEIYIDAVDTIGREAYSSSQVAAWQRWPTDEPDSFRERVLVGHCWMAEVDGEAAAFAEFTGPDHLDFLYTRGRFARLGLATKLHEHLERLAKARGATRLRTEASFLSRPAFSKFGYEVYATETVERFNETFTRFLMRKFLGVGSPATSTPSPCLAAHQKSFDVVPLVQLGDAVTWVEDDSQHPGWFKGTTSDGVVGYFPRTWFEVDEAKGQAVALRDYDASELTVSAGQPVGVIETESGWARVMTLDGEIGWVPRTAVSAQP